MKFDAVPGQFDDVDDSLSEPPPKLRRFEEIISAESVDYTEDDGFPLESVLNYFAVRSVLDKNDVQKEDAETVLIETLMKLKANGKTDFDIFQTRKGAIRVKLCPVSKYDHEDDDDNIEYEQ